MPRFVMSLSIAMMLVVNTAFAESVEFTRADYGYAASAYSQGQVTAESENSPFYASDYDDELVEDDVFAESYVHVTAAVGDDAYASWTNTTTVHCNTGTSATSYGPNFGIDSSGPDAQHTTIEDAATSSSGHGHGSFDGAFVVGEPSGPYDAIIMEGTISLDVSLFGGGCTGYYAYVQVGDSWLSYDQDNGLMGFIAEAGTSGEYIFDYYAVGYSSPISQYVTPDQQLNVSATTSYYQANQSPPLVSAWPEFNVHGSLSARAFEY